MAAKKNGSTYRLMSQAEIVNTYGISKSLIDKYLPKPVVKSGPRRRGGWYYQRFWYQNDVEAALKQQEVKDFIKRRSDSMHQEAMRAEIRAMLSAYNPESLILRAKELKRAFVLHVGPTNSGKTHDAVKALKESGCGAYLGPLRLLALEMYDRINADGIPCSLLTGEESIPEEGAKIVSSTIELCDFKTHYSVAVIDEAQLITDSSRGSAWFQAICRVNADEVHICLAPEALEIIEELVVQFGDPYSVVTHERLVPLKYSGRCKGYRDIRPHDALICFSRKNVLSTAALLERNGFKASVIYGALPPVARRNEVSRYLAGETDVVVATDAIGMGISLPIRRIIFTEVFKFDGRERRALTPPEVKQIAGRAGRYGMYDLGEVLTMDSSDIIQRGLSNRSRAVKKLCISFPREALATDYPLDLLMKIWQSLPENREFTRENMQDPIILYSVLRGSAEGKDRELVYELITCPVDTGSHELVYYWLDCARAILRGKYVPFPRFGTDTLADCELQYKACDIHHQLMMRIGCEDNTAEERKRVCARIKELMQEDKSSYIRRCSCCGKELPMGYAFNLCEKCYTKG